MKWKKKIKTDKIRRTKESEKRNKTYLEAIKAAKTKLQPKRKKNEMEEGN